LNFDSHLGAPLSEVSVEFVIVYLYMNKTRTTTRFYCAVVWNPWQKGLAMADLGEEYINMLCVEAGHVTDRVHLAAGCQFQAAQSLTIVS
jgi:D-hexose-6-phosphate mutarotase